MNPVSFSISLAILASVILGDSFTMIQSEGVSGKDFFFKYCSNHAFGKEGNVVFGILNDKNSILSDGSGMPLIPVVQYHYRSGGDPQSPSKFQKVKQYVNEKIGRSNCKIMSMALPDMETGKYRIVSVENPDLEDPKIKLIAKTRLFKVHQLPTSEFIGAQLQHNSYRDVHDKIAEKYKPTKKGPQRGAYMRF
ncbi:hypothetical protein MP228_007814 [Amoeboaphelidium protococcarum]|nr:hypothetical protein MP228_007814 [Amoeboaphelidium protococcarum]